MCGVEAGGEFYDEDFFRTVAVSGARALLIGRRALIALGAPVMTSDYDVWLHFDDVEKLNAAFAALDHYPNHPPEEARKRGRYVLENGQRVDVLIARAATAPTLERLTFQEAWDARQTLQIGEGLVSELPSIDLLLPRRQGTTPSMRRRGPLGGSGREPFPARTPKAAGDRRSTRTEGIG